MVVNIDIIILTRKGNITSFLKNKIHFYVITENQTSVLNLRTEAPRKRDMIMVFRIVTPTRCHNPEDRSLIVL